MKSKKILFLVFFLLAICISVSIFGIKKLSKPTYSEGESEEEMYYKLTQIEEFPIVDGSINTMDLNEDESILYIGGYFTRVGELDRTNLAAIDTNTYAVLDWAPEANGEVHALKEYQGSVYVGGGFNKINNVETGAFVKIKEDGELDLDCLKDIYIENIDTYGLLGYQNGGEGQEYPELKEQGYVYSIEITSDYIYVGGLFNRVGEDERYSLARFNNNEICSLDLNWFEGQAFLNDIWFSEDPVEEMIEAVQESGEDYLGSIFAIKEDKGELYVGGSFSSFIDFNATKGYLSGEFVKLNSNGELDSNCNPLILRLGPSCTVYSIELSEDYIYIGGHFDQIGNDEVLNIVRLNREASCSWDDSWIPQVSPFDYQRYISSIVLLEEDILIGGSFMDIGYLESPKFAKLDKYTGNPDLNFNLLVDIEDEDYNLESSVTSLLLGNGRIYLGGTFETINGSRATGLAAVSFIKEQIPVYNIETIEDLDSIRENLGGKYVLTRDLDFESCDSYLNCENKEYFTGDVGWKPIGDVFWGSFDGQGYTISNLYINNLEAEESVGLFKNIYFKSEVKNLALTNVSITAKNQYYLNAGSIAGVNQGKVSNSFATGNIVANVTVNPESNLTVGGLVGVQVGTVTDSYSAVNCNGGGLVGSNWGEIINSYSVAKIEGNTNTGGLVGFSEGGMISNSFWDTETSEIDQSAGGEGKTTEEMQSISTYTDWDIVEKSNFNPSDPSIWYIEEGEDYPRLYYEYQSPKVSTLSASDIQSTSAVLNGNLTDTDGEDSISVYFQYKRKSSQEWRSTEPTLKDSVGLFGTKISKLLPNKEYEYRAVIKWRNVGIVYGDIFRFTTPPIEYEEVETTVNEIEDYTNTETELIITNEEEGSIEFPPGLNLEDNIEEFLDLEEYLVVEYVPVRNIFRARVHSTGLSYLATQPAIIKFMNVSKRLGVSSLTSNNFREYMRITVFDDRGREVNNTSSYYDWNLATYNSQTDILRLPVNHFSEYVLGA